MSGCNWVFMIARFVGVVRDRRHVDQICETRTKNGRKGGVGMTWFGLYMARTRRNGDSELLLSGWLSQGVVMDDRNGSGLIKLSGLVKARDHHTLPIGTCSSSCTALYNLIE